MRELSRFFAKYERDCDSCGHRIVVGDYVYSDRVEQRMTEAVCSNACVDAAVVRVAFLRIAEDR